MFAILFVLCIVLFLLCYLGTGTDEKNLKSYSSYPDEVQRRIKNIAEYQGRFQESNKVAAFASNFLLFLVLLFVCGMGLREKSFRHNFLALTVIGQGLNFFDLLVIDLLWWRNTKRIRFTKLPEKELYQNPRKHVEAFCRALVMYLLIAIIDGYLLTLFWEASAKEYADKRINDHLSQFNSDCTIVSTAYGFVSAEMPYYVVGYQCNNGVNDFFYGYKITVDDCYECAVLDEGTDTGRALFEWPFPARRGPVRPPLIGDESEFEEEIW